jgi:hypothetical protein
MWAWTEEDAVRVSREEIEREKRYWTDRIGHPCVVPGASEKRIAELETLEPQLC